MARAFVRKTSIFIMDEATASIDMATVGAGHTRGVGVLERVFGGVREKVAQNSPETQVAFITSRVIWSRKGDGLGDPDSS